MDANNEIEVHSVLMRYTQMAPFQKHLASAAPDHLCRVYLVSCADPFERKGVLDSLLAVAASPDALVVRYTGAETSVREILDALGSPMLFGGEPIVVVDEVDKKLHDALAAWFKEPLAFGYLFLGAKGKIGGSFAEAAGVVLDLTEEKPWDREKRLGEKLQAMAKNAGMRMSPDAAQLLLERASGDAALMAHEMEKLVCFAADKQEITRGDVEALCKSNRSFTLWQIADDLIWERVFRANEAEMGDSSFFHGLVAGLRQQLALGMKMCALRGAGVPFGEWKSHFPKIWPKTLEKKAEMAARLGGAYFGRGLELLFQVELLSKSGSLPTDALLDYFRIKL